MEPNDLNSPLNDDSRLEMLLRQPAPALPDDGFSTRVLAALPARIPARRPGLRLVFCSAGAVTGLIIASLVSTTSSGGLAGLNELGRTASRLVETFSNPNVFLALTVTAVSLVFTLWHRSPLNARN
jgi:hypothetical protein